MEHHTLIRLHIKKHYLIFFLFMTSFVLAGQPARKLKILYVVDAFPKLTETFIAENIVGMIEKGHDISVYARKRVTNKKVHPVVTEYKLLDRTYFGSLPPDLQEYDIILCQFGHLGYLFPKKRLSKKTKLVTCIRGSDITQNIEKKIKKYNQLFLEGDLFLPVCHYFKRILRRLSCSEEKIMVYGSPINCEAFPYQERHWQPGQTLEIISIGRLVAKKGRRTLIRAVEILSQKYPVHLTIVGNGTEKENLLAFVKRLNVEEKVTFIFTANQTEIRKLLERAHIFILTSETARDGNEEGIPNAFKEAMASGNIVIGTYHAAIPELIFHQKTGLLVKQKNPFAVVKAIEWILNNKDKWLQITKAARLYVEKNFDRHVLATELESILLKIVENKRIL